MNLTLNSELFVGWPSRPEGLKANQLLLQPPPNLQLRFLGASHGETDRSAPPWDLVIRRLDQMIKEAGVDRPIPQHLWKRKLTRRWRALRDLIIFSLEIVYGPRPSELEALDVIHFDPNHRFMGWTAPALAWHQQSRTTEDAVLDPAKARNRFIFKELVEDLALWLEMWIVISNRTLGQPGQPLLLAKPWDGDREPERLSGRSIEFLFNGSSRKGRMATIACGLPLLARDVLDMPVGTILNTDNGPYALRAVARRDDKVLVSLDFGFARRSDNVNRVRTPLPEAEYLLDEAVRDPEGNPFSNPYKGYSIGRYRHLAVQAAEGAGLLWKTQHPEPTAHIPVERIGEIWVDHSDPDQGYRDRNRTRDRERIISQVLPYVWNQFRGRLADSHEQMAILRAEDAQLEVAALEASQRLASESGLSSAAALEIASLLSEIRLRQNTIKEQIHESARLLETCDTDPDDGVDLARELTTADAARLYGRSEGTVVSWRRGTQTPSFQPWFGHAWRRVGPKDWRLNVARINPDALTGQQLRLLESLRRDRARRGYQTGSVREAATPAQLSRLALGGLERDERSGRYRSPTAVDAHRGGSPNGV